MQTNTQLTTFEKLQNLLSKHFPGEKLDNSMGPKLNCFCMKFLADIFNRSCTLAKHRQGPDGLCRVEYRDVALILETQYDYVFGERCGEGKLPLPTDEYLTEKGNINKDKN